MLSYSLHYRAFNLKKISLTFKHSILSGKCLLREYGRWQSLLDPGHFCGISCRGHPSLWAPLCFSPAETPQLCCTKFWRLLSNSALYTQINVVPLYFGEDDVHSMRALRSILDTNKQDPGSSD